MSAPQFRRDEKATAVASSTKYDQGWCDVGKTSGLQSIIQVSITI